MIRLALISATVARWNPDFPKRVYCVHRALMGHEWDFSLTYVVRIEACKYARSVWR